MSSKFHKIIPELILNNNQLKFKIELNKIIKPNKFFKYINSFININNNIYDLGIFSQTFRHSIKNETMDFLYILNPEKQLLFEHFKNDSSLSLFINEHCFKNPGFTITFIKYLNNQDITRNILFNILTKNNKELFHEITKLLSDEDVIPLFKTALELYIEFEEEISKNFDIKYFFNNRFKKILINQNDLIQDIFIKKMSQDLLIAFQKNQPEKINYEFYNIIFFDLNYKGDHGFSQDNYDGYNIVFKTIHNIYNKCELMKKLNENINNSTTITFKKI